MNTPSKSLRLALACAALILAGTSGASAAQSQTAGRRAGAMAVTGSNEERSDAYVEVNKAVQVLRRMEATPALASLLDRASGVFVVPNYASAAFVVGGRGGAGVLLVRRGGTWVDPAFYKLGGISAGVQAGAEAGAIALVLNNQKALDGFTQENKFSLGADAGLTIMDWEAKGQASAGRGDITLWSDTKGLFGGAAVSLSDVNYDADKTASYYGRRVAARDIVIGNVGDPQASSLQLALAGTGTVGASSSVGSSGAAGTTSSSKEHKK